MSEHALKAIRRAGVPLCCFETSDPAQTITACARALNGRGETTPIMQWDILNGLRGVNDAGIQAGNDIAPNGPIESGNPGECLKLLAEKAPESSLVFWHQANRFVEDVSVCQGVWNLRDAFKGRGATLVMLAPAITLPDSIKQDVVIVTEALPDAAEISDIVDSICADAGLPGEIEGKANIVDTLLGLSAFAAEQALAMSISKTGIDRAGLWERKRRMIEQTPGLSVWRGGDTFRDIGGCENVKSFLKDIMGGKRAPRAVAFIDEIEKVLAGSGGDTSGVSQDYLGALLTFMQDKEASGLIFIGPPGAAKSAVAKAAGNEGNIPTIQLDLGGMKGSLVGESERRLRQALQVIDAVSQGKTLFIATCNSFGNLPPELKRRFTLGTYFFDLPSPEDRAAIWKIYCAKYDVSGPVPNDDGWTGAEIKACCDIAARTGRTLAESSRRIVPVAKSAADTIESLRRQAGGKFISASSPGVYQYTSQASAPAGRKMEI